MTGLLDAKGNIICHTSQELLAMDGGTEIIAFTDGMRENGEHYWAYVAVKPSRYSAFMSATKARKAIALAEYGRILRSGNDAAVPHEIQQEMKRDYGFDEHYIDKLLQRLAKEQNAFMEQKEEKRIAAIISMLKKKQARAPKSAL